MRALVLNLIMALGWASFFGSITPSMLLAGFVFSYLLLWWLRRLVGPTSYFQKVPQLLSFIWFFLVSLVIANLRVAWDVISFRRNSRPGIVALPLDLQSDLEITLLAAFIALTPGTMAMDVSNDRKIMYIHAMFITDPQALRDQLKQGLERRILELMR